MERAELSKKSPYWISRHRYYELKHFCRQYKDWKKGLADLNMLRSDSVIKPGNEPANSDPTAEMAAKRAWYIERITMIDDAGYEADPVIGDYIVIGVTEGLSYDLLKARLNISCCKDRYYEYYRKFFWLLSEKRQ